MGKKDKISIKNKGKKQPIKTNVILLKLKKIATIFMYIMMLKMISKESVVL